MVNVVLLITSLVFAILVLIAAVYFLVYFQHPEDKWAAWLPRGIVVIGMALACYNVLLLPLDVANQAGSLSAGGQLPMAQIEVIFFFTTVLFSLVAVPFAMFYYEGLDTPDEDDEKQKTKSQLGYAIKWMIPTLIAMALVIFLMYWFLGVAEVPVTVLTSGVVDLYEIPEGSNIFTISTYCQNGNTCNAYNTQVNVTVNVIIYTIALTSFVGWILFVFYGGIGLSSLPMDLILVYKDRPRPITKSQFEDGKKKVGLQASNLMETRTKIEEERKELLTRKGGKSVLDRGFRQLRNKELKFKKDVDNLDRDYRVLKEAHEASYNIIWLWTQLALGIIGVVVSVSWFLHILIYMIPIQLGLFPFDPFLNQMFVVLDGIPFFGITIYGFFIFYLLAAVINGTYKVGLRIVFTKIHPMIYGETVMSSLVFNVGLILFSSLSITQFSASAFADYARYTAIQSIFSAMVSHLRGLKYIYGAYIWILMIVAFLGACYFALVPRKSEKRKNQNLFKRFLQRVNRK